MAGWLRSWLDRRWRLVCDVCFEEVDDHDERCPHCGAFWSNPEREEHEHAVTMTWRAVSAREIEEIGGWVHDAYFDWDRIAFDPNQCIVRIPFEQEPTGVEECGQPGERLVARRPDGSSLWKVPFVRCVATIHHATACEVGKRRRDEPGMLNEIRMAGPDKITVKAVTGPEIRVNVTEVEIVIQMTDELAFYRRRVRSRFGVESDSQWTEPNF